MNTPEYQQMLQGFRDGARSMMFSASTIDWFASASTPKQIGAAARLIGMELATRAENRKARLLRQAAFPCVKSAEDFDFAGASFQGGFSKERLLSLEFVEMAENLVLYGPSGRGKTHLAVAVGMLAVSSGKAVRFYTASDLVRALGAAHRANTLDRLYAQISRLDMLVVDEFGYIPFDSEGARLFFQVMSKCYEARSVVFTTNIEFSHWGTVLGDDKLAAATIDRVVHHGRLITFSGPNRRMDGALMMGEARHHARQAQKTDKADGG